MKYLEQKPGPLWWTKNIRYLTYFVRELSGITLGLLAFIFIVTFPAAILFRIGNVIPFISALAWIGLISSLIHTLTWLSAIPKILPLQLSAVQQKIAYAVLVIAWLALSYLLINTLYQPPMYV